MMRKILIVDDDQKTRVLLKAYLEKNQYEVILSHNGESFVAEFNSQVNQLSLVILDVMLPDTDGFALCKVVRQRSNVPIIMLTASSDDTDRIVGLELGADDYIAKPYNPRELLARIKAILRRTALDVAAAPRYYRFVGFTLDLVERKVTDSTGEVVALTGLDYQLLKYFVEHPGDVLDRNVLSEETRGRDAGPLDRSLDVQISRLRLLLKDDSKQPSLIKTVRGAGYVFSADVSIASA
ncbi:response regulator [Undibacterium sp. CY18W]|uniref:Response regulator n=1 Tax=Undibacterium hunanense TaxID=2762292 RepID=A0ABR6ZLF5_9BURK|nr:response regulator [Undibacterium hunanense]MBC3916729.1 response regulator [Undibacterium hunanense]